MPTSKLDSDEFRLLFPGQGMEQALDHLGLPMTSSQEGWTGVLVSQHEVWMTTISDPEGQGARQPGFYECVFRNGHVLKEFQDEERRLRQQATSRLGSLFGYYINLNERGSFYADVRNTSGESVYEVRMGNELEEDCTDLVEDGFMRHNKDVDGLANHLKALGVMPPGSFLLHAGEFERQCDELTEGFASRGLLGAPSFATAAPDAASIAAALSQVPGAADLARPRMR